MVNMMITKRNTTYNRKCNEKKKNEFKNLLKEEKSKLIFQKRLKERLRQQKHREKLRQQCTPNINKQGYSSVQALSCATNLKLESIYHRVLLNKEQL